MRGKTSAATGEHVGRIEASMRPPQNAGENPEQNNTNTNNNAASMRPPQNAGENDNPHSRR